MCGFAGVVAWDDRYRVDRAVLERMSARIAHRGPDGEGIWISHEAEVTPNRPQCGLAHRRLAIIDPDHRADQPFHVYDEHGRPRLTLVFNGEIYNFRELRRELSQLRPDYRWRTECDTEVLLVAYDVWGEHCVDRLNGMFAFAVLNKGDANLFLARDRMGEKPLYLAVSTASTEAGQPAVVAFASELPALREIEWIDHDLWPTALHEYLMFGYVPSRMTIYCGVQKLLPGHWRTIGSRGAGETRYFNAGGHLADGPQDDADAPGRARRLLELSVRRRLVSDVPLGCLLSGGIDSSVVALAMKRASPQQPVLTFSIGFDDQRYDETPYAAQVAKHLGTLHQQFIVRPNAIEDLPKLAAVFGEPFADSSALPMHYLAQQTRPHVKVALSGDGGDELFGGYDRYRAMELAERMQRWPSPVRALAAARVWQALPGTHPKSRLARLKRFQQTLRHPPGVRYAAYMRLFSAELLAELYSGQFKLWTDPQIVANEWFSTYLEHREVVQASLALDRVTYLPGDLLAKVDRASMLHALEVRSPFMDHELVQFAAGLTTDQLLRGGPKRMLREAFADDLPAWVFKRRKMGFAVPIGEWFRTDANLRAMLHDHLFAADSFARGHFNLPVVQRLIDEHEQQRQDHSQRLYALLMLELWWRMNGK